MTSANNVAVRRICLIALLIATFLNNSTSSFAATKNTPVTATVISVTDDTLTLKIHGRHHRFHIGDIGIVWRNGIRLAVVQILRLKKGVAETDIFTRTDQIPLRGGELVQFERRIATTESNARSVSSPATQTTATVAAPVSTGSPSTLKSSSSDDDFVPLLAPLTLKKKALATQASNIFHGRLRARNIYQSVDTTGVHYLTSQLDTDGNLERINGGAWSLTWAGNVSYRDGNAFSTATDFRQAQWHAYRLMLSTKGQHGNFTRLGRILPYEISGLGYVDGFQQEIHPTNHWRFGAVVGAKPDRKDLGVSGKEWLGSAYSTLEAGAPKTLYFSGTLGALQTIYKGMSDELAALYDQRIDLGSKFSLFSTSQLDFNSGAAKVKTEPRFTRFDIYGFSPLATFLSLKAGANHYERPDTNAERDLTGQDNLAAFDAGYYRYYLNASEPLPSNFRLSEEVSLLKSADNTTQTIWRGDISHQGFFYDPAVITLTGYTLNKLEGDGVGGIATLSVPALYNRLSVNLNSGFRYSGRSGEAKKLKARDLSLFSSWRINPKWNLDINLTRTFEDSIHSTVVDSGITYHW